ncbi:apolipoprotein B-100 [Echinops telfairi]|uniref:Apolipoprotein B-100 n=1 Tax=Echinops telfairi TaxID=9371 RepID=A0AC55CSS1_ECHTE|nr:apolipoprotein B-100 [Echinops telfairi]
MGPPRPALLLLLLLLLAGSVPAQEEALERENVISSCPKDATRFKHLRKYVYTYEAESSSGVPGTADSRSATKITCKVELEVPQLCSFVLKTSQCTLKEVYGISPEGKALLKKTKNSEEFSTAMSKYELRLTIPKGKQVLLYPATDEPKHILNIKRGIISALLVPPETEEDKQVLFLDTVYGNCSSDFAVKSRAANVATEIGIERKLERCDHTRPLSTLVSSSQSCQYTLDAKKKHVSEAICKEQHLFLPFSYKNKYGMMARVTQSLKLEDTPKINTRFFDEGVEAVGLALESTKSTSPPKQTEAIVKTLQELQHLSVSEQNAQRAKLFHKLVTELRGLRNEAVASLLPKLIEVSSPVTLQALVQCGQPQCYTHILQWLRTEKANPLLIDVVTYLMALIPEPSAERVREIFITAKEQQSRATLYALSHVVNNYYKITQQATQILLDIMNYLLTQIQENCTGDTDHVYLILKVIGNMGKTIDQVSPSLKSAVLKCVRSTEPSLLIQRAAIQSLRKMATNDEVQRALLQAFLSGVAPVDKRLAAYLMLMKGPSQSDISRIARLLPREQNEHVKNFVATHIANILNSEDLSIQHLKMLVEEALKGSQLPTIADFRKYSRNYQLSKSVSLPSLGPVSTKIEGNLIFDPNSYLPKESMLKTTLTVFGFSALDLFEIGVEGKGFEPTLEALFGKQGFFPDSVNKALYWVDGHVPDQVSKVLVDHFGYTRNNRHEQDMVNGIMFNIEKLIKDLKSKDIPEASAYLRFLGEELGFVRLSDLQHLGRLLLSGVQNLQGIPQLIKEAIRKGSMNDLFLHYIFMDNAFELPTGAGLQLQVSSSGIIAPGTKAGVKVEVANMQADLVAKPSVSVEFVTNMGIIIPDFAKSGVQMNTNFFHESGLEARVALKAGQLKFIVPTPKRPVKLFSGSNTLHLTSTTKTEAVLPLAVDRQSWTTCKPFFTGLNYCTTGAYSNASSTDDSSYYPLTGDTRFELELRPTGEVEQYSSSATYELKREGQALVDTLKFVTQAEGVKQTEATMMFKYNRQRRTLSSEIQIPDFDVDLGTILRVSDESAQDKKAYKLTLDIQNNKITEVTLTGHMSCDMKEKGKIKGVISIPRLQAEARSEILTHWSPTKLLLQVDSSATAFGSRVSKKVAWRYDEEKMEFEWNAGTNVDTRKVASNFPVDLSDIPQSLLMYANSLLDHRVPQTDMTFRHMGSKLIVATNTWLQKTSRNLPYTQILQDHLSGLEEMNLQKMGLPDFHLPENLFLKSDGRFKYTLNKNSVQFEIPVPFGGRSSQDLNILETVRTPALHFKSVGFQLPSQEFRIPTFVIPKVYLLRVPLLGVLDLSTNVYSNAYNWSASFTGGNTSTDHFGLKAQYLMRAMSAVDLFSYSVQGSGETTYDHRNTFTLSCDGSLRHKFLDSNIKFNHVEKSGKNPASKGLLTFDATSAWGPQLSASVHLDTKKKQHLNVKEVKVEGQFRVSSFYTKGIWGLAYQRDLNTGELHGESNLRFNSSYIQGTSQMTGRYEDGALTFTSNSDLQDGLLKNTVSLKYENYELTVKSDTNGRYRDFATSSKVDVTVSRQNALFRSEYQANYNALRFYSVLSGSLDSHGLELNADVLGSDTLNSGAHKATLRVDRGGLSTSATTNLKYSPLVLENELNAGVGFSGATLKLTANGRFREHHAKLILDGKAGLTEISLGSAYQAMILGVDSKNIFNFKINQEGLKLSSDMMGSYAEMKLDYTNSLTMADLSLDFASKLDNVYSSDKFYKQNFHLKLQPYALVTTLNNDLKVNALQLTNNGKLQLEPLKLNMGGTIKGAYENNEIKHIYAMSYADLSATYKADTVAKVRDAEFSHRLSTDIAGLASAIDISTNYNSDSLHFSNVFHSTMEPFTMTIDAHTNANGKLALWGEHTGQLYSKLLWKAKPLALTFSHDYKGSTSHHLMTKRSIETALEHQVNALLTPAEQMGTWKLKTQLNKHEYSQDFDAYNTKDKVGVELSGRALADLTVLDWPINVPFILTEPVNVFDALEMRDVADQPQEFTIVASVKYDKNQDVHTIDLPFLQILPEYFEKNRIAIITALERIQRHLKHININQISRKYKASLDQVPQQVNDYLKAFNWEAQVTNAKEKLTAFTKDYRITANDLQIALDNAKINLNEKLSQLQTYVIQFDQYIKDNYDLHDLKLAIAKIIDLIIERLKVLDENYRIRVNLIKTIHDLHVLVEKIDFNKMGSSTEAWIQNMDTKYQIRIQLQEKLQQLRTQIQNIDIQHLAEKLKHQVETIDIRVLLDHLRTAIPIQSLKDIIEHVRHFVVNLIEDLEVTEVINAFRAQVHDLIKKYEVDQQIQVLMDKSVQLAHQYKLKETLQRLSSALKRVEIKAYFEKLVGCIDDVVKKLKALHFENFMGEVNRFLDVLVEKLRSFDYNQFVDETNNKIREMTQRINSEILAVDLPQKVEALKVFVEEVKAVMSVYWAALKDTKITVFLDWLQEAFSSTSLRYMKARFQETLEDTRDRVYQMDIQQELQRYLSLISQAYKTLVMYVSDWWILAEKALTDFAEQYSIQDWAESIKGLVEQGFTVPEIRTVFWAMPSFEVSLRALKGATFQTPDFIVPMTDLRIPSVEINFKTLKDIKVPSKFTTPEFTVLNTFHVPSFTIDLIEIKAKLIRTIDQMLSSELQWPVPEIYLRDLKVNDTLLAGITLPDFYLPQFTIPEIIIPKINVKDFEVPNLHIPEFQLPHISHTIQIPTFGKLYGILKIQSSLFTLDANAAIQNITTSVNKAEMVATFTAKGESKLEVLNFDFQANAQLSDSELNSIIVKESMKLSNKYLKTEHSSQVVFSGNAIEGKSDTLASLHTEKNTMELSNSMLLNINQQFALESNTKYTHKLSIPQLDFSSQADLRNGMKTLWEAGRIGWTSSGTGSWKWACPKFSDEGTHESQINFTVEGPTASFGLSNKINSKHLRVNQKLLGESGFLNYLKFEIESQVDSQHVGRSILTAKGAALLGEMKAEITGTHDASLNGKVIGTLKNSLVFSAQPFEIMASTNNEGNLKVSFPFKLTGKIDFLNNYALLLNPSVQQASWQASARFNQYKYHQNFSAGNNENSMEAHVGMNGEANLDFLNIPLTIPEMTLPYMTLTTPQVKDFSLWERTGLKDFLKTTKQSFDLSVKAQYKKNKGRHSIPVPLDVFYDFINQHIKSFNKYLEKVRDSAVYLQSESYNIPWSLRKLSLPDFQLPQTSNNIFVPALGNMTYEFSFKSSVITLNTNVGLYNQSDIVAHLLSSSSSFITALQYKLEGTSSLTRKRGLKLATAWSLSNKFVEGSHDSTMSLTRKNMEASMATSANVQFPILRMNFKQELNGNTKAKPTLSAAIELKYDFNCPRLYSAAKGAVDHKFNFEGLSSYLSMESSTKGNVKGSVLSREYSGNLASEVNTYLNSKGTRSSVILRGASRLDGIWNLEVKENFAGEATLSRIYAIWEHSTKNLLQLQGTFVTSGEHTSKATLELSPWKMAALVQVRASQPNSLLDIPYFGQEGVLNADTENQKVSWKSEVQVHTGSLQSNFQLSNGQKEARLDIAGSLEGHLSFLKEVVLPIYDKSVWDLLKLDVTTSSGRRQSLHAATALVYTKNPNGYYFSIPVKELADEFIIPGLKLNDPNSILVTPTWRVPLTNLHIPSYTLDFSEIKISKKLSTSPFDLNIPTLPKVKFPQIDVLTKYSEPEESSVPFFEVTVPGSQLIVSPFTLSKSISVGSATLDLNKIANKIADFDLPTITVPEQMIAVPSMTFSVPAGIFIPSLGSLSARFAVTSPLYNSTWSAGWKNKADHFETFLDTTCSSTLQFLEYDLNIVGTHKFEDGALVCKTQGTFSHRDLSAEYKEDGKYQTLADWLGEARLDITSPKFTDIHLHYQSDEKSLFSSIASSAIGSVVLNLEEEDEDAFKLEFYYLPQSSPGKKFNILTTEWKYQESDNEMQIKVNWEEEATSQLLSSLKDNVPKATGALYDYINVYHREHTGVDLRDVSSRLRRSIENGAELAYLGALRQINKADIGLRRAAGSTARAYKQWKDEAQNLYQDYFQNLSDRVYDSSIQVIQTYNTTITHLIDSLIEFLRAIRFQLPGKARTYTGAELCTMVTSEVGKVLFQGNLIVQSGLNVLIAYVHELGKNSELIKRLEFILPFHYGTYSLTDEFVGAGKLLHALLEEIQKEFNRLQSKTSTELLTDLKALQQEILQEVEKKVLKLKRNKLSDVVSTIQDMISMTFNKLIPYIFTCLKEHLYNFKELAQNKIQEVSQKLKELHEYIKTLREEYFDPSMVGWTVKYYELEEKVTNIVTTLIIILQDLHSTYTVTSAYFISELSSQYEQFMSENVQEYLIILADGHGKGTEKITELCTIAQDIIKRWATAMKEIISGYYQQFPLKLQNFADQLSDYYEEFLTESKRLIDLSIQKYHMFLSYLTELLNKLQSDIANDLSPYFKVVPGEIIITF